MTLTMLWKNHRKTLINLPWKYHESNSTHFCFPIFGWLISSKSENFDAVAIHQFWSKWPQTKPKWLILVCFTTNFAPKRYFFELRCPNGQTDDIHLILRKAQGTKFGKVGTRVPQLKMNFHWSGDGRKASQNYPLRLGPRSFGSKLMDLDGLKVSH